MKKQTAVEWLIEEMILKLDVRIENTFDGNNLLNQAKEMEKEQIIDAFGVGCHVESTRLIHYDDMAEQYYNETFKNL